MKTEQQIKTEQLYNYILGAPDLGAPILNFLLPYINKAQALLKEHDFLQSKGKTLFDYNTHFELQSIIFKDLPAIVEIYLTQPLEYRNTSILRDGKTNRTILFRNLETLVSRIAQIEQTLLKEQHQNNDKEMLVQTRNINNKYGDSLMEMASNGNPLEQELHIDSQFDLDLFKRQNPQHAIKEDEFNLKSIQPDNNLKVKFVDGEISYQVKNHFKDIKKKIGPFLKKCHQKTCAFIEATFPLCMILAIVFIAVSGSYVFNYIQSFKNKPVKMLELVEMHINANSPKIAQFNFAHLKQLEKEHPYFYIKENRNLFEVSVKANQKECVYAIDSIKHSFRSERFNYYVNGAPMIKNSKTSEEVDKAICGLAENTIQVRYYAYQ